MCHGRFDSDDRHHPARAGLSFSCFLTARKDGKCCARPPTLRSAKYAGIAQQVEQVICNHQVVGSIPATGSSGCGPPRFFFLLSPLTAGKTAPPGAGQRSRQPGAVAQQAERPPCKREVAGSIPVSSTSASGKAPMVFSLPKPGSQTTAAGHHRPLAQQVRAPGS